MNLIIHNSYEEIVVRKMCDILGENYKTKKEKALHHHLLNCDMLLCQMSLWDKLYNDSKLPEVLSTISFSPVILARWHISLVPKSSLTLRNLIEKKKRQNDLKTWTHTWLWRNWG